MKFNIRSGRRSIDFLKYDRMNSLLSNESLTFNTSGSTGEPKIVRHESDAMIANASEFNYAAFIDSRVRMYHCLPLDYMGGFLNTVLSPAVAGGMTYVGDAFSPLTFWGDIVRERLNAFWISPTMAYALTELYRGRDGAKDIAERVRHAFCGFAPLSPSIRREWQEVFGIPLIESYGSNELMLVSVQSRSDAEQCLSNVGYPLRGIDVAIDADHSELLIQAPWAAGIYVDDAGWMEEMPRRHDYLATGDIARLDDGRLIITGRLKEIIKRGGVTISPLIIENAIRSIRGSPDVAVIGVPDDVLGEKVVLFIEDDGQGGLSVDIKKALEEMHILDNTYHISLFPRSSSGKVLKRELLRIATSICGV